MVIYLDTNILIDLLCENSRRIFHEAATKLIRFMKYLGIEMRFTKRTSEELRRRISISNEIIKQIGSDAKKRKLLEYVDDPFIQEYSEKLKEMPSLIWEGFIGRIKNFAKILERKYGIIYDGSDYAEIMNDPRFSEVSKLISETNREKPAPLVEHDCFHILLVDMLRSKLAQPTIVPKFWFVTRDKTVCLADQMRLLSEGREENAQKRPSSVLIDVWLQMTFPFLSPELAIQEASRAFSQIFSSNFLPSYPRMRPQLLVEVLSPLLDQTDLEADEIKAIIGDIYLAEHYQELAKSGELPFYLNKKLLQIKEEKYKRQIAELQAQLDKSEQEKMI
ncbi:hypothetical protein J7L18_07630 [Candidatus Bathyarchaeota archaeon]|nr:hypothetical protein [Candidatus Bathyarchaeota archaeon]